MVRQGGSGTGRDAADREGVREVEQFAPRLQTRVGVRMDIDMRGLRSDRRCGTAAYKGLTGRRCEAVREMEFKMERPGLLKEGDKVTVTEGVLPSNYYYTIDPSLAMSGNFPFRERMMEREGVVTEVIENARGFYVRARFGE